MTSSEIIFHHWPSLNPPRRTCNLILMFILVFTIISIFAHFLWTLSWFHVTSLILLMSVAALAPSKITFLVSSIFIKFTVFIWVRNNITFFGLLLRALSVISACSQIGNMRSRRSCCTAWLFSLIYAFHYMLLCGPFSLWPSFLSYVSPI